MMGVRWLKNKILKQKIKYSKFSQYPLSNTEERKNITTHSRNL